ncbi:MAG: penicillin-binding protein 1C [Croceimicrobium sp.]
MGRGNRRLTFKRLSLVAFFIFGIWWWNCLPEPLFNRPYSTVTEAEDGQLLGARIAADEQWRFPPADSIPWRFKRCIVLFEDANFYYHPGFDPLAIFRALRQNWKAGSIVSGGSTISMQCIRLARGNPPRTYWEKATEILRAMRLELAYSKEEILALYCSQAPFGGNVVGLEAAAWRYFGLAPHQLSWSECAALAVLPNAPGIIHPGRNRDQFRVKRNRLLAKIIGEQEMDSLSYRLSLMEPLPAQPYPLPDIAHHLSQYQAKLKPQSRLKSSLNAQWQRRVQELTDLHLNKWRGNQVHNASALVMDLKDGSIKAYVGNSSNRKVDGSAYNMLLEPRSTGSLLKPILYADAMAQGQLSPSSIIPDIPTRFGDFTPSNFDQRYRGATRTSEALQKSLNVPAARVLRDMGVAIFLHRLQAYGLKDLNSDPNHYGLSLILGGAEVNAEQLAHMYRRWIWAMQERKADTVYDILGRPKSYGPIPNSDPAAIYASLNIMEGLNRPSAWKQWNNRMAWKTGTSYGFRDAWAIGTNGRWLVICWTGNANYEGRPGVIGVETSAPLLFQIMDFLPRAKFFESPFDWQYQKVICAESGFQAGAHCTFKDTIYGAKAPLKNCSYCQAIFLNSKGLRIHRDCQAEELIDTSWMILSPAMAWYAQRSEANYNVPPPWDPNCNSISEANLEFIYPEHFEVVQRTRDFEGKLGKIILEAGHRFGEAEVFWYADDVYLGMTRLRHRLEVALDAGTHQLLIMDEQGNIARSKIKVVE